jgi:hypothetical protein
MQCEVDCAMGTHGWGFQYFNPAMGTQSSGWVFIKAKTHPVGTHWVAKNPTRDLTELAQASLYIICI